MDKLLKQGKLYLVSTPIGNYEDITIRALNILKQVDFIICEEFKEAKKLLNHYNIQKDLLQINEHNEKENSNEIIALLKQGKSLALISDCGTPLFSDPGNFLVKLAIQNDIQIVPIPGPNSVIQALVGSGIDLRRFLFYGWLPAKKEARVQELKKLSKLNEVIVLMETPYRLQKLLGEILDFFIPNTYVVLAYELTTTNETYFRGRIKDVFEIAKNNNLKGEFVLIIDNLKHKKLNYSNLAR
ncbi:MAG TPA: 16S rRNA (cytidine(1402)-2'-O)-methyltransferase [Ignavibacteriales bacterium]|nr:16S rRNA (cytidine(1402)-2'-O)-methyltransferase [Ignavibacteriales bacterium]